MLLWLIFAAITAASLAAVLWPMLHAKSRAGAGETHDVAIYRDQLAEIEADLQRGLIGAEEAESAKTEVSRRLLAAAEGDEAPNGGPDERMGRLPLACAIVAAFAIPLFALSIYLTFGSPHIPDQPLAARLEKPDGSQEIASLVAKVEARLRAHPEDGRGWDVIAPVYLRMQRYRDAADAYGNALRLEGESAARLSGFGEALVLADNGIVSERARVAFKKALERDDKLAKPRFWLGIAAEQDGRFEEALTIWKGMLAGASDETPWRGMVEERLKLAQAKVGKAGGETPGGAVGSGDDKAAAPGPTREEVTAAQQMTAQERAAMINQMVEGLADRLKQDGSDLQGWLRLVRAYSVLGQKDKARDALDSARDNFKDNEQALAQLSTLAKGLGL